MSGRTFGLRFEIAIGRLRVDGLATQTFVVHECGGRMPVGLTEPMPPATQP